jgi:tRNA 2-thiouridine synthesizing protein A
MNHHYDVLLDVRHEDSPTPTIRTKEVLDGLASGEILKVITSKESTIKNIRTLVANNPYHLVDHSKSDEGFVFIIQKL